MDPDANLQEQLHIVAQIVAITDAADPDTGELGAVQVDQLSAHGQRLADLVEALNGWIAGGGFLPRAWQGGR